MEEGDASRVCNGQEEGRFDGTVPKAQMKISANSVAPMRSSFAKQGLRPGNREVECVALAAAHSEEDNGG